MTTHIHPWSKHQVPEQGLLGHVQNPGIVFPRAHAEGGGAVLPAPGAPLTLRAIRAVVLLSGSVGREPFASMLRRSVLDLPIDAKTSLLDHWVSNTATLLNATGLDQISLRVRLSRDAPIPSPSVRDPRVRFHVDRDIHDFRGTGGVLRDLAQEHDENDYLLVATAAQFLSEPLVDLATSLVNRGGDVALIAHTDGTPVSLMLMRAGCLRTISPVGYVDMKEQALPEIASRHCVNVIRREQPIGMPIRTGAQYIAALHRHHRGAADAKAVGDLWEAEYTSRFELCEPAASIHPTARVHDSVVLRGGRVEAGAVLVRSIVCDGAVVNRSRYVVDSVVSRVAPSVRPSSWYDGPPQSVFAKASAADRT